MTKLVVRALVVCGAGMASLAPALAETKVAIINIQKAILETGEIKKAQAALEAKYKPRQAELEKVQKELQDLQAQLQSGKLNPQAEQEANARGQRRQREAQRLTDDLQADVDRERNEILQKAGAHMTEVIKKIAEEKGFDMVVDVGSTLYFKPAMEITNEAVQAYDKAYPVK